MSRRAFFSSPPHVVQLVLLLLDLAGIIVSAVSADTLTFFNPLLRPLLFIAMSSRARRAVFTFLRVLPDLAKWAAMLLLLLGFYALLGVVLFGPPQPLLGADADYFSSVPRALLSLVVLITTANFPDVMLRAYTASRESILFFASFPLVGVFFLMNMCASEEPLNWPCALHPSCLGGGGSIPWSWWWRWMYPSAVASAGFSLSVDLIHSTRQVSRRDLFQLQAAARRRGDRGAPRAR